MDIAIKNTISGGYGYDIPSCESVITKMYNKEELPAWVDVEVWKDAEYNVDEPWIEFVTFRSGDIDFHPTLQIVPAEVYGELLRLRNVRK